MVKNTPPTVQIAVLKYNCQTVLLGLVIASIMLSKYSSLGKPNGLLFISSVDLNTSINKIIKGTAQMIARMTRIVWLIVWPRLNFHPFLIVLPPVFSPVLLKNDLVQRGPHQMQPTRRWHNLRAIFPYPPDRRQT